MSRYFARRLLLSLITLWLLATIVFVITNILPSDVGRTILGPFAPQESVDALNQRLGTDRPLIVQYLDQLRRIVTLDFGDSFVSQQAVLPQILGAIGRSAKLAGLALLISIPISIVAGLYAGRRRDSKVDRADRARRCDLVVRSPSSSRGPSSWSSSGVQLHLLPVLATPPPDADIPTQIRYLLMPATWPWPSSTSDTSPG